MGGSRAILDRKLENQKKNKIVDDYLFLGIKYCQNTALYPSPATTCTKFSVHVRDWFPKKWMGGGGRWMFFWMSGIALTLQEP